MLTEIASNITNLVISFFILSFRLIVNGITMNSVISFVRNVESKAENKMKKRDKLLSVLRLDKSLLEKKEKYPLSLIPVVIISNPVKAKTVCQSTKKG